MHDYSFLPFSFLRVSIVYISRCKVEKNLYLLKLCSFVIIINFQVSTPRNSINAFSFQGKPFVAIFFWKQWRSSIHSHSFVFGNLIQMPLTVEGNILRYSIKILFTCSKFKRFLSHEYNIINRDCVGRGSSISIKEFTC